MIRRFVLALTVLCLGTVTAQAQEMMTVSVAFVSQEVELPPALSNLDEVPDDLGLQGARLGLRDNNTTGKFMKQKYELEETTLREDEDAVAAVLELVKKGHQLFVLDLPSDSLKKVLAGVRDKNILFFNARSKDNDLRQQSCDARMLHTIPSRAMLGDALAQFMVTKRWQKWFLIAGQRAEDVKFADSLKRSAKKFGAKIVEDKSWDGARDARRTAQAEVPLLTQGPDYDVLMVADELGDFGEYLMYRTFDPRPVAGTQGLFSVGWYWTQEQWGAAQLQKRFAKKTRRRMGERDYATWVAVRSIGEAATRTKSNAYEDLNGYIRSDDFQLAAFKGRKLSYRKWNGQLRQPIALSAARSLVAQAPLEGFLHKTTELDTLGFDQPETQCKEFLK
ncbi:ABC transporter substrate-binding protein [Terasakiella sp. A23]|uniref:ABC transporter substrate-binding protein n=1 Tax=Terasakiella sp. FCG-A23 TaxID=3080561 RepID=UPI002955AC11|nr:ABC transporter substrate-binding protein [Terasakiella sp. A23]MDV7339347.1 ABC transporter substrate-binding protein [Terasakiella sp. A23]